MIRLLFVTNVPPWPPYGGQYIRTYNLLDSLSQMPGLVAPAVLSPKVPADCPLPALIPQWYTMPDEKMRVSHLGLFRPQPTWQAAVQAAIQDHRPDVVWFDNAFWGHHFPLVRQQNAAIILGRHNAEPRLTAQRASTMSRRWHRWLGWARAQAEAWHERRFTPRTDLVVTVSEPDQAYYQRLSRGVEVVLLPNYINEAWYVPENPIQRVDDSITITANYNSFQNWHGTNWFLQKVWPRVLETTSGARLQLVGQGADVFANSSAQNVDLVGQVPSVTPYLRQSTIAAVPLLHGSGTRFKILEAFAAEIPVISTTLGADGLDINAGRHLLLADLLAAFATGLVNLLQSPAQRRSLAQNAYDLLRNEYGFAVNTERMRHIMRRFAPAGHEPG